MLSTNGCYDINHLTPYLEKGHIGQKLSLMSILNELCPDNATHAFPKCGANCSNNELISPSPTHAAEPSNVISTSTKADLFGEKKAPISELSESKKIRKMIKFRKFNPLRFTKWSSNLLTKSQIAKSLQLRHQIYHVTPQCLTLESLKVIVQKWFWRSKTQSKITKQRLWRCPRGVCHKCL